MMNQEHVNNQNIQAQYPNEFGGGPYTLPPLPDQIIAARERAETRQEVARQEQLQHDQQNAPLITDWISRCEEGVDISTRYPLGLRQLSGVTGDANDYGDYFRTASRTCALLFSAHTGALRSIGLMDSVGIPGETDDVVVCTPSEPTPENLARLISNYRHVPVNLLSSVHIQNAYDYIIGAERVFPSRSIPGESVGRIMTFKLVHAWRSLNTAITNGNETVREIAIHNKNLLIPFIISTQQTQGSANIIKKEIDELKIYVKKWILHKPEFHAQAWNMYRSWINKVNEISEACASISEHHKNIWKSVLIDEPRHRHTKSAGCR